MADQDVSLLCDLAAPMAGGLLGAALTLPSYAVPTPFQVGLSIATAGLIGHAAGVLCHHAVDVFTAPPGSTPNAKEQLVMLTEGAARS